MKAIALVVVFGGVAEVYQPEHVDCRIIDLDNMPHDNGSGFVSLPRDIGFEKLVADAGLVEGEDFSWEAAQS